VWDARVSSKTTNKTLAVVQSSALNKYAKEDKQNSASNTNNNNNNAAPRGDSRQWMDLKMNKIGTNFNIDTMSKQEIAAKFDKHAPHW
jgi:type IV secretory pathway VirB9-like protein